MKQITSSKDIMQLGTIMSVWAHPDDETFSSAGIMATAVRNGQKVICLTATKGEAGVQDPTRWPPHEIAEIRAREMRDALRIIGVDNHHWLDYRDGDCNSVDQNNAVQKIVQYMELYKPNTILTFGPEGMTGHDDHKTVSLWVDSAVRQSNQPCNIYHAVVSEPQYNKYLHHVDKKIDMFFNIDSPPIHQASKCDIAYLCDQKTRLLKRQAIESMPSQTEVMFNHFDTNFIDEAFKYECFVRYSLN